MLLDPNFAEACQRRIREHRQDAAQAVATEIGALEQELLELKRPYLAARAADLRDLGRQLLRHLGSPGRTPAHPLARLQPGTVAVANELLLTDALRMDVPNVAAIETEHTGPASHVARLARLKGIPALCDIQDAVTLLASGDRLLVDGERGTVTVAPTPVQGARFAARRSRAAALDRETAECARPCATSDGVEINLLGSIAHPNEAVTVLEHGLKGVGLFRSELSFRQTNRPPDLESQAAAYEDVAAMLHPRPVIIRTIDLGGDKIPA
jgi:phosphoenolpyruvate-protein kinase (PTS system EI component)